MFQKSDARWHGREGPGLQELSVHPAGGLGNLAEKHSGQSPVPHFREDRNVEMHQVSVVFEVNGSRYRQNSVSVSTRDGPEIVVEVRWGGPESRDRLLQRECSRI
tara:strand:- start:296 stop:610 length:315 start_codon:yes stop_codon:yes gene_type:complete